MEQIRSCYEQGMTPEEIAQDRELTVVAVKTALASCCPKYKKTCAVEPAEESEHNFSDEELLVANRVIVETMHGAEDEGLRFKAATYVRDDKKGRKDVVKQIGGFQFNVLQIDARMRKAMEAINVPKFLPNSK
jgi:hypothetical protein